MIDTPFYKAKKMPIKFQQGMHIDYKHNFYFILFVWSSLISLVSCMQGYKFQTTLKEFLLATPLDSINKRFDLPSSYVSWFFYWLICLKE